MSTAPSAGATYPVGIHCAVEVVEGRQDGLYTFDVRSEEFRLSKSGPIFEAIQKVSLDQDFITQANLLILMVYDPAIIESEYGESAYKYAAFECGHIAQNIMLMATSLGLGSVPVGAFEERPLAAIIGVPEGKEVMYYVAIGMIEG